MWWTYRMIGFLMLVLFLFWGWRTPPPVMKGLTLSPILRSVRILGLGFLGEERLKPHVSKYTKHSIIKLCLSQEQRIRISCRFPGDAIAEVSEQLRLRRLYLFIPLCARCNPFPLGSLACLTGCSTSLSLSVGTCRPVSMYLSILSSICCCVFSISSS